MDKINKRSLVDVVPLTRIPLARQQYFSYESDRELPAGTLVNIPLFFRVLNGIVIKSRDDFERMGNIRIKKITNVVEENFLTPEQLELAQFISDYYFCPLGVVLKFFVPKRVKARNLKLTTVNLQQKKIKLTKEQQGAVDEIIKKINWKLEIGNWKFLLYGPASSGKTEVYIHAISNIKDHKPKSQFLVLLPELTLTPQAVERYGAIFKPDEIAVIHSKITKGELYSNWKKIKSGEIRIIIGTRMAVFAPFNNLKLIIIDEEQDISFKQWDMNPRYDARKAAEKLAIIHQAKIVRGSATPSLETYYRAELGAYKLLKLPYLKLTTHNSQPIHVEIVDMRKERWKKNFSCISQKLKTEIDIALKNKMQTILFINRQGMSAFTICEACKSVLHCPKCAHALLYQNEGIYKCPRCSYASGAFATCSKCKGLSFINIGLGTQKVEREIARFFPDAKIKRVDFEVMKKVHDADKLFREFSRGDYDILIGTQMITKGWDNPGVGLIGIIDADNLLSLPDFRAEERAFQLMAQVAGRCGRPGSLFPGKVIIQSFHPENFIVQAVSRMDYAGFYEKEIGNRKIFAYPPVGRIIKLTNRNKSEKAVEKAALMVYNDLAKACAKNEIIQILLPQSPLFSNRKSQFVKQIIIRIKDAQKSLDPGIIRILSSLGSDWIIDIDPISII